MLVDVSPYGHVDLGIYSQTLHDSHILGSPLLSASSKLDLVEQTGPDLYERHQF
jgi:hypothetical protein